MSTNKYSTAVEYASKKHANQIRRGVVNKPYIVHPLGVAKILKKHGAKDEVVIAGVLHDVVEDTNTPLKEIKNLFGKRIAKLVESVTEKGTGITWDERLKKYLNKIDISPKETKMICAADKIDNMQSMVDCISNGYDIFKYMHAGKEKQISKFKTVLSHIEEHLSPELANLYKKTLNTLIKISK